MKGLDIFLHTTKSYVYDRFPFEKVHFVSPSIFNLFPEADLYINIVNLF